jgi:hypothetical protein
MAPNRFVGNQFIRDFIRNITSKLLEISDTAIISEQTDRRPDLEFFYSLALPSTVINKVSNGSDIIQTANGFIFADRLYTQPIGRFAFNVTIIDANSTDPFKKLYETIGTNVFFLPQGTISNSINLNFIKDPITGNFVVPIDLLNVYQILSGSGDFLNQRGIIVQTTAANLFRAIFVYFDK